MPASERAMAEACLEYVERVVVPGDVHAGRDRLGPYLEDLYARRLQLPDARERAEAARTVLENPRGVLVEIAHDGQLPHLGIVRLVLKAREVAELAGDGLALYLVGDHYTADMRPENLFLGLPSRGVDPDRTKNPLTVSVGRKQRHMPFHRFPPPTTEVLDELARRADSWVVNNASYAGRKATAAPLRERLAAQMERLRESAAATRSFGDWLMRVQILWLDDLLGEPSPRLAVLPMSGIMDWIPDVLYTLSQADEEIGRIKARVSEAQENRGEIPYRPEEDAGGVFWIHCANCWRRHRAVREGDRYTATCASCNRTVEATWPGDGRLMPDIVAFESALFRMGLSGWIVGSRAAYHPVIEATYRALSGTEMPPKRVVSSVPRFRGIGEPPEGHTRARLLRVLLEVEPKALRQALEIPWDEDPRIDSPYL